MTRDELAEMAAGYIEAALFTADEEIVAPKSGEFDASPYLGRVDEVSKAGALAQCRDFFDANAADLADYPARSAGHDLWYTRNGHGCGFWEADHCTRDQGERLADAARKLGERYLYAADNGALCIGY